MARAEKQLRSKECSPRPGTHSCGKGIESSNPDVQQLRERAKILEHSENKRPENNWRKMNLG
jgi:hypothetical protein